MHQDLLILPRNDEYLVRPLYGEDPGNLFSSGDAALSFAIGALSGRGSITLASGTYLLEKEVALRSGLTLRGSGWGTELCFAEKHDSGIALSGEGLDSVVVSDLSIKSGLDGGLGKVGVRFRNCGGCEVSDAQFVGLAVSGVEIVDNSFLCEVRGCRFGDIGGRAILMKDLFADGRGGDFVPNLITNCIIYGGGAGIECDKAIVLNIVACEAYQTQGPGFLIHKHSNSVLLSGCRTFQIRNDAVVVDASHEINITGNIFCWHDGNGIVLRDVTWGSVTGNNVIDTGHINIVDDEALKNWTYSARVPADMDVGSHLKHGILLEQICKGLVLTGNAIFNWGTNTPLRHGIEVKDDCIDIMVTGNHINYSEGEGVAIAGESNQAHLNRSTPLPYIGAHNVPPVTMHRYDVRRIERFIEAQRRM